MIVEESTMRKWLMVDDIPWYIPQTRLHEVPLRKCARFTQSLSWVSTEVSNLPTCKGLPNFEVFIGKFEDRVSKPQRLLSLEEAQKDTPRGWWATHNASISNWKICQ